MSVVLLLLGKAIKSGANGELMNWRWFDTGPVCIGSCHYRFQCGCYVFEPVEEEMVECSTASNVIENFCGRQILRQGEFKEQKQVTYGAHTHVDA